LLAAVYFSGQVVWSRQIDQPVTSQADVGPFGPGASPAIYRNRLFLVSDEHPNVWWLAAFDTQTGKPLWRIQEAKERGFGWSTPLVWEHKARTELVTVSKRRVNSYDIDGHPLWHLNGLWKHDPNPICSGRLALTRLQVIPVPSVLCMSFDRGARRRLAQGG
jgi:outer membrane protein assembly factor BamB